jgi:hypothetical protein
MRLHFILFIYIEVSSLPIAIITLSTTEDFFLSNVRSCQAYRTSSIEYAHMNSLRKDSYVGDT